MLSFLRFLRGFYKIKISGYSPERFFNLCRINGIVLWDIIPVQDFFECKIKHCDFKKIDAFLNKYEFSKCTSQDEELKILLPRMSLG